MIECAFSIRVVCFLEFDNEGLLLKGSMDSFIQYLFGLLSILDIKPVPFILMVRTNTWVSSNRRLLI